MSAIVQDRPVAAPVAPKALTLEAREEQATALHSEVQTLLAPLVSSSNYGSHCTRIIGMLLDFFNEIDQSDNLPWLDATHTVEAMLNGALNCGDCEPIEQVVLQAALAKMTPLQDLLDCPSWGGNTTPAIDHIEPATPSACPAPAAPKIDPTRAAKCVLEEIAFAASELDTACFYRGSDGDLADMVNQVMQLREGINRLGLMADIGAAHLGGVQRLTVEQWLLPPIYTDAAGIRNRYS